MEIGPMLVSARRQAGLTQEELADRSGTSQATLSAYERGAKTPSAATLTRVLAAAGVRLTTEPAARPVRTPGRAALEQAGRTLVDVIELAALLPTEHSSMLAFPRLPGPS